MDHLLLICTLVGCATALAVFGHRILVQVMARVDAMAAGLRTDLDRRFSEVETRRVDASNAYHVAWDARHSAMDERMHAQKEEIAQLRGQQDALRQMLAEGYVSRETWHAHIGATNIKLDKLLEEFHRNLARTPR